MDEASRQALFFHYFSHFYAHMDPSQLQLYTSQHTDTTHLLLSLILVALFCIPHFYHLSDSVILPLSLPTRTSPFPPNVTSGLFSGYRFSYLAFLDTTTLK
ncbi:hypothetical protein QCA50_016098 [Cerrena zonata]|uniref:Uncharacterized protein n=1 Tax=Cerrena zonata TaxID=2478898 RepID=A0AAW0FGX7_9APHY